MPLFHHFLCSVLMSGFSSLTMQSITLLQVQLVWAAMSGRYVKNAEFCEHQHRFVYKLNKLS